MEDKQLLLAEQDYAGTREMLRRVGILAVDKTFNFTVKAIGEAKADLVDVRIECKQLDGTWKTFAVGPAGTAVASAVPGVGNLRFGSTIVSGILVNNVGTVDGPLTCKLHDAVKTIFERTSPVVGVGSGWVFPDFATDEVITFDMPAHDYTLYVEVGH